jgi:eukaryotic-like serine/threonine-protein kinase
MIGIGTKLAHYEITSHLGSGGMGEVYQAIDAKLGRSVAIKLLPEAFTHETDRATRFEREARVLASLNHPNIAAIYGIEQSGERKFLVMELVPGETLAERIKRGRVPIDEALRIAKSICGALEAAHEKGVVHRDLKPANVKITPQGTVKVLDFGLAKVHEAEQPNASLSNSPTLLSGSTPGMIMGTAAYMSPEQARGQKVDCRTDIWALGCVLYELLTGHSPFHRDPSRANQRHDINGAAQGEADTVQDIIARVLQAEPDWTALPKNIPRGIPILLRRCMEKNASRRFHAAADVLIFMEETLTTPTNAELNVVDAPHPPWRRALLWATVSAVVAGIAVGLAVWNLKLTPPAQGPAHVVIPLPPGDRVAGDMALSPDGSTLVYVAVHNGVQQLFVRVMDSREAKPVPGTDGAAIPFFSPDSKWIGFFAAAKLKKVPIAGGTAQTLCDSLGAGGASWGTDDTIVFSPSNSSGLMRVSAAGGKPQVLTTLDHTQGELSHRYPHFLPGGKALLFTVSAGNGWDEKHVAALKLETGERHVVLRAGHTGRFVPTGHLLYYRAGSLLAVPFDPVRLQVISSAPVTIAEGVAELGATVAANYSFSDSGSLAYVPAGPRQFERRLVWVDRKGDVEPLPSPTRPFESLALSPDGRQAAIEIQSDTTHVWIYDLPRGTLTRLTTEGSSQVPIWTPDGKRIAYRATREGFRNVFWRAADGSGAEERLTTGETQQTPDSWSPDGKLLAFDQGSPTTGSDIWILRVEGDPAKPGKPLAFHRTPFDETSPVFSPNGRWAAYRSNESGRFEVYVQPFPGPGAKWQISTDGGSRPRWAHNGSEMFYVNGAKLMAVAVSTSSTFSAGKPRLIFEGRFEAYDVSPDGQRFLIVQAVEPELPATQINVVLNWFDELKQRVPVH